MARQEDAHPSYGPEYLRGRQSMQVDVLNLINSIDTVDVDGNALCPDAVRRHIYGEVQMMRMVPDYLDEE